MRNSIDQYDLRFPSKILEAFILLQRVADMMARAQEKAFESLHAASLIEVWVLYVLVHTPEAPTPTEIGRWIFRKQHSTGELLQRMERRGLVTRVKDKRDRRLTKILISPKGERIYERTNATRIVAKLMAGLNDKELAELHQVLSELQRSASSYLGLRLKVKQVKPLEYARSGDANEQPTVASTSRPPAVKGPQKITLRVP